MTAKTRHGRAAHRPAHGADKGTPHERLNRLHAQPGRPEGAMHGGASGGAPAAPAALAMPGSATMPPQPQDNTMPMAPPGAGPSAGSSDDEEGDQT